VKIRVDDDLIKTDKRIRSTLHSCGETHPLLHAIVAGDHFGKKIFPLIERHFRQETELAHIDTKDGDPPASNEPGCREHRAVSAECDEELASARKFRHLT
jgi:hypothetical protein